MAPPQPAGGQPDNSYAILWGVAAVFAALGGIWYVYKEQIVSAFLKLKLYETNLLLPYFPSKYTPLRTAILYALSNPKNITFTQVVDLGQQVGHYLRYPFIGLMLLLGIVIYVGNTARSFKRTYSMRELAQLEKENWPQINPVIKRDLLTENINQGPWAMAMTPIQFCKRYRLLDEVRPQRREGMSRKEWDRVEIILKKGPANQIFALQLGPIWRNANALPPHIRALFAAFAARINADSQAAANLFQQLNRSSQSKLNLAGVDDLIKKHLNTKLVQQRVQNHAYVFTVMASMLEGARDDGVQAAADFLWLKPVDRKLWYILNTVGRQTPFIEVAGIYAHWLAEKEAGHKLFVPMVEEATKALEVALTEVAYKPDEDQ